MGLVPVHVPDELLQSPAGLGVVAVPREQPDQTETERLDTVRGGAQYSAGKVGGVVG